MNILKPKIPKGIFLALVMLVLFYNRVVMNFGEAFFELKKGLRVCREDWNGKDMFIYYVPANSYPAHTGVAKEYFGEIVPYGSYIAMKTPQGNVVPWLASQIDLLADDWVTLKRLKYETV